jgi:hypothetical protein
LLGAPSAAQNPPNPFEKWDRTSESTSRGLLGGAAGFLSQAFPPGFAAGLDLLRSVQYVIQDQNMATQEPWHVGFAGLDAVGHADYASTALFAKDLRLPLGTGIGAYIVTHSLMSVRIAPSCEQWHFCWQLTLTANWATDGIGVHLSSADPSSLPLLCTTTSGTRHREIPRIDGVPARQIAEELAWSQSPPPFPPAPVDLAWRLTLGVDTVTLNGAAFNATYNGAPCPNPNFGYASLDPDLADLALGVPARFDDYQFVVTAGQPYQSGVALLYLSIAVYPGAGLPTPLGRLFVDLADPLMALGPLTFPPLAGSGEATLTLPLGGPSSGARLAIANLPAISAQAVCVDRAAVQSRLSNLFTFRPRALPAGFQASVATTAGIIVARPLLSATLLVRSDGRGTLSVQQKANATAIGPAVLVCERSAVRVSLMPATTQVELRSNKAAGTQFVYTF